MWIIAADWSEVDEAVDDPAGVELPATDELAGAVVALPPALLLPDEHAASTPKASVATASPPARHSRAGSGRSESGRLVLGLADISSS
ncbi:MAG: hypothetical protein ABIP57_03575 [Jatrophihabitantaceae bacterium]